jgi:hypothetical protein
LFWAYYSYRRTKFHFDMIKKEPYSFTKFLKDKERNPLSLDSIHRSLRVGLGNPLSYIPWVAGGLGAIDAVIDPGSGVKSPEFEASSTRRKMNFSTNRQNLWNSKMFDLPDGLQKEFLMGIPAWKLELIFASRIHQTSGQKEQVYTNRLQSGRRPRWRQAQALEPTDQVVSQKNQVKVRLVGREAFGGNLAQREALFEFPDVQFAPATLGVITPHRWSVQGQIAHQSMVVMIFELPQSPLHLLILFLWLGTANHGEMMGLVPMAGLISELSHLPAARFAKGAVTQRLNPLFDGLGHIGHDGVTDSILVERFDELVIVKPGVRSEANPVKILGNLAAALFPKLQRSGGSVSIARAQQTMPAVPRGAIETQQGMIAGPAPLLWIVAHVGFLDLPAIHRKDRGIQIEDQAAGSSWQTEHLLAQHIVDAPEALDFLHAQTFEEFPQSRSVRESVQPQQVLKITVVRKDASLRNALHPSHHDIEHGHNDLGWVVMIAAALPINMPLQQSLQIQLSTKPLKKKHSAVVRKPRILEGKIDFLQSFSHSTQSSLLVRFVRQRFLMSYYIQTPSELTKFLTEIYSFSRLIQGQFLPKSLIS